MVSKTPNSEQIHIQLRDSHMRLVAFFHPSRLVQIMERENIMHLYENIQSLCENAQPGKIYEINYNINQ